MRDWSLQGYRDVRNCNIQLTTKRETCSSEGRLLSCDLSAVLADFVEIVLVCAGAFSYVMGTEDTNLKVRICRTIILPVVLYGCETWSLTLRERNVG